jgi:hypothetical protein
MSHSLARLRRHLFGISPGETLVERRGFAVSDPRIRSRIEEIGATFVEGYHAALLENDPQRLADVLNRIPPERRGFAFEGAAMGLRVLDFFTPWRSRWREFLEGPGAAHVYILYVGAGWALARLPPLPAGAAWNRLDPLLRWLALDGYGFHEGYFHGQRSIHGRQRPRRWTGYALNAFDQGLGRSLWFVKGGDAGRIAAAIAAFPAERHGDLWSGVGLASAYAGGVDEAVLTALREAAGDFLPELAQGAAFAAKTRQRAGNPAEHTDRACRIFCGMAADEAARITDQTLADLPPDGDKPAYEHWRQRIQSRFAAGDTP